MNKIMYYLVIIFFETLNLQYQLILPLKEELSAGFIRLL